MKKSRPGGQYRTVEGSRYPGGLRGGVYGRNPWPLAANFPNGLAELDLPVRGRLDTGDTRRSGMALRLLGDDSTGRRFTRLPLRRSHLCQHLDRQRPDGVTPPPPDMTLVKLYHAMRMHICFPESSLL